jgi:hypothetical protein
VPMPTSTARRKRALMVVSSDGWFSCAGRPDLHVAILSRAGYNGKIVRSYRAI